VTLSLINNELLETSQCVISCLQSVYHYSLAKYEQIAINMTKKRNDKNEKKKYIAKLN